MAEQELLLLQILKIPVIVIKYLAKILSIGTYLPNYLILYVIDQVLFGERFRSTWVMYVTMWLPKVGMLGLGLALFCGEFYGLFMGMKLGEEWWVIQVVGMVMALAGLLILMRKGYLSLIEKYHLSKLKSVLEHVEVGYDFFIDLVGVVLAIVNCLMLVNIGKTLTYKYDSEKKHKYLRYIFNLVRESIIFYIECFYVKIFLWIFPWRFIREKQTYLKEKYENNVLNCLVLLTLVFLGTVVDILFFIGLGWINLIYFKRMVYIRKLGQTHEKWKVTGRHFGFVCGHLLQLIFEVILLLICPFEGWRCLKKLMEKEKVSDLFGDEFSTLVIRASIRLPYFICNLFIFVMVYKYKRKHLLLNKFKDSKKQKSEKQIHQQQKFIVENTTFKCFFQLCLEIFFIPLIVIASVLNPWRGGWVLFVMSDQYELKRSEILKYLYKCVYETVALPFCVLINLVISIYQVRKPYSNLVLTKKEVEKRYRQYLQKFQKKNIIVDPIEQYTFQQSVILKFTVLSFETLLKDIPNLPAFIMTKMTFLSIYDHKLEPQTVSNLVLTLVMEYYQQAAAASKRGEFYQNMYGRMMASGNIQKVSQELIFWRTAYKCQKLILFQRIVKVFLMKRQIEWIDKKTIKGTTLTQISNQYWYQSQLLKAYIFRVIRMIIELILTVIGFTLLLPLTLWRLPTFVILYKHHKTKKLFFKILFKMYGQMWQDIKWIPVKICAFAIAPLMLVSFMRKTGFQYGAQGIDSFDKYQKAKQKYLFDSIILDNILPWILNCEVVFIYMTWIRIKNLRAYLRGKKLSTRKLYSQYILKRARVPSVQQMVNNSQDKSFFLSLQDHLNAVHQIFKESLKDLPYLFIIAVLFITMPWRINHIVRSIRDTREDSGQRKAFIKLLRHIFTDYACIFMNVVLLFSGFKTRKALVLIRRNYKLNFFIGFLEYSYFNELVKQIKSLAFIYADIVNFIVICAFGWTRSHLLVKQLLGHRKKLKEEEISAMENMKIYKNTVESGKQLQLLNKMGFYNYLTVCSYLHIPDLISLRRVDKLNYQMSKREEIWFTKWETLYTKKHNLIDEEFEIRCRKAFLLEQSGNPRMIITYHSILMDHWKINVEEGRVDLALFAKEQLKQSTYNRIFRYYRFRLEEGYGPENELPQSDDEDPQFLRLTNQVRRPRVELTQNQSWLNWLAFRPIEGIIQKMHVYFRVDRDRKKKQAQFLLIAICTVISLLFFVFKMLVGILWLQDSLVGLRLILLIYLWGLMFIFVARWERIYPNLVSLIPFDLYYDIVNFVKYVKEDIIVKKLLTPSGNFVRKCWKWVVGKVKIVWNFIVKIAKKVGNRVKQAGEKTMDVFVKTSTIVFQRLIKPLYLQIADKLRKIKNLIVLISKQIYTALRAVFMSIYNFLSSTLQAIYNGIHSIFSNANKLYYLILDKSMRELLKFGFIGNLIFTFWGLFLMTLPSIIWWFIYHERWYLVVSTIHTMVLIVVGYRHLNRIREKQRQ